MYAQSPKTKTTSEVFAPFFPPARYLRVDDTWQCDEGFGGAEIILDRLKASSSRKRDYLQNDFSILQLDFGLEHLIVHSPKCSHVCIFFVFTTLYAMCLY